MRDALPLERRRTQLAPAAALLTSEVSFEVTD
jgi:hypothetical protein